MARKEYYILVLCTDVLLVRESNIFTCSWMIWRQLLLNKKRETGEKQDVPWKDDGNIDVLCCLCCVASPSAISRAAAKAGLCLALCFSCHIICVLTFLYIVQMVTKNHLSHLAVRCLFTSYSFLKFITFPFPHLYTHNSYLRCVG